MVFEHLRESSLSDYSAWRLTTLMRRFVAYAESRAAGQNLAAITQDHVRDFVFAPIVANGRPKPPEPATMHLRRSAVRLLFRSARELALCASDPTLDLFLPARSSVQCRPLTDDEIILCRSAALYSLTATTRAAAWALAEATARTSEIPRIRRGDINFHQRRVWLHGGSKTEERWGQLSEWGCAQLRRHLEQNDGYIEGAPLIYGGSGRGPSAQSSSCVTIKRTLIHAGLGCEPDVHPLSIAAWAGLRVYGECGRIEEAARGLGMRSLDGAARLMGIQWRTEPAPDKSWTS
jgi:integrase/recombinase XerC